MAEFFGEARFTLLFIQAYPEDDSRTYRHFTCPALAFDGE